MRDAGIEVLIFLGFAIVLNTVVFGGITLAYFLDKHREDPPRRHGATARPVPARARRNA